MAWDPTAQKPPQWVDIESSRDGDGVAHGRILCQPWNAGKRLAYENRMTEAIKYETDGATGVKVRKILTGNLRVLALELTVIDSEGFGPAADFTSRAWINTLNPDVLDECIDAAATVQPLPTAGKLKRPEDRKAAQVESGPELDDDADEGDGDVEDPTRRPSTPAE